MYELNISLLYITFIKYYININEKMEDIDEIRNHANDFEKDLFKVLHEDKYRIKPLGRDKMKYEDFIEFKDYSQTYKKEYKLKTYMELPPDDVNYIGIVYSFHGMQSHANTLATIAIELSKIGLVTVAFDYRGHGFSEGINGDIESFDELINTAKLFINSVENYFKSMIELKKYNIKNENFLKERYCQGLSMGGLLCYFLSLTLDFKGVLFYAPAFDLFTSCFEKFVIKYVFKCFNKIEIESSDPPTNYKNLNTYDNKDPIIENIKIKSRTVNEMYLYMIKAQNSFKDYNTNFLLIIPAVDKIVPPKSMIKFYESCKSNFKKVYYYKNLWHSIVLEEEIFDIIEKIKIWIVNPEK